MNKLTKKYIAREFIYFILSILICISILVFNIYKNNDLINKIEINKKELVKIYSEKYIIFSELNEFVNSLEHNVNSLEHNYQINRNNRVFNDIEGVKNYFNNFYNSKIWYSYINGENFLQEYYKTEINKFIIKFYYSSNSSNYSILLWKLIFKPTLENENRKIVNIEKGKQILKKYFYTETQIKNYNKKYDLNKLKKSILNKNLDILSKKQVLNFNQIINKSKKYWIFTFIFLFLIRYLILGLIWSVKTLKNQ